MINYDAIGILLSDIFEKYEKSAPVVSEWADRLYMRMAGKSDEFATVRLCEIDLAIRIKGVDGEDWMQPNYAANSVYKMMERLGQDTTGMAGF